MYNIIVWLCWQAKLEDLVLKGPGVLQHLSIGLELTLLDIVTLMLIISDNTSAKMLVKKFTPQKINEYIKSLGFEVTGLKIDGEKFINTMKKSNNENRIKRYLPTDRYNDKVKLGIASKGGSIPGVRSDVGIIFEKEPYSLCVLSKDLPDESNKPENKGVLAIAVISKLIFGAK